MTLQSTEAPPAGEAPRTLSGIVGEAPDSFVGDTANALPNCRPASCSWRSRR